jgi:asparagine synthase (glutamine-hydrolysing)
VCGIAGAVGGRPVTADETTGALDRIQHRGPDDQGQWREDGVWLGHRRLAVVDLTPTGHQPMASGDGRFQIVYNGETYNHPQLRRDLDAGPAPAWKGRSDTEVLLEAIAAYGVEEALGRVNGQFAFAVWDRAEQVLHLARDRFGEKPLYWALRDGRLAFASELTALEALLGPGLTVSREALGLYFQYGYVPAPLSIYQDVFKLPPGCRLTWHQGAAPKVQSYWRLKDCVDAGRNDRLTDPAEAAAQLETLLLDAVKGQMEADVPLGSFLSGGVDSSLITAMMQAQSAKPVKTFTAGFESPEFNEAGHARAVAEHLGCEHTEFHVTMAEARAVVPTLGAMFDEPFADSSQIPTFLISRLARAKVTVCLTGDGGDEMFGGYVRYPGVPRLWNSLKRVPMRRALARLIDRAPMPLLEGALGFLAPIARQYSAKGALAPNLKKAAAWLPAASQADLYDRTMSAWMDPDSVLLGQGADRRPCAAPPAFSDPIEALIWRDTLDYLPGDILCKVDRAAMASSLETRTPFLDPRIAGFVWRLPMDLKVRDGQGKWLLRQVLYKYVPRALIDRPKMGFTVPLHGWLTGELRGWAQDLLGPATIARQGLLRQSAVDRVWARYLAGDTSVGHQVWTLLMFQSWMAARNR